MKIFDYDATDSFAHISLDRLDDDADDEGSDEEFADETEFQRNARIQANAERHLVKIEPIITAPVKRSQPMPQLEDDLQMQPPQKKRKLNPPYVNLCSSDDS